MSKQLTEMSMSSELVPYLADVCDTGRWYAPAGRIGGLILAIEHEHVEIAVIGLPRIANFDAVRSCWQD